MASNQNTKKVMPEPDKADKIPVIMNNTPVLLINAINQFLPEVTLKEKISIAIEMDR